MKCLRCGRPLKDPVSVEIGMGKICRTKKGGIQMDLFKTKCSFDWVMVEGVIVMTDHNTGGMSLTNDIENALKRVAFELQEQPLSESRIIMYLDSQGIYDGVRLVNGDAEFYSVGETDLGSAIEKIKSMPHENNA